MKTIPHRRNSLKFPITPYHTLSAHTDTEIEAAIIHLLAAPQGTVPVTQYKPTVCA